MSLLQGALLLAASTALPAPHEGGDAHHMGPMANLAFANKKLREGDAVAVKAFLKVNHSLHELGQLPDSVDAASDDVGACCRCPKLHQCKGCKNAMDYRTDPATFFTNAVGTTPKGPDYILSNYAACPAIKMTYAQSAGTVEKPAHQVCGKAALDGEKLDKKGNVARAIYEDIYTYQACTCFEGKILGPNKIKIKYNEPFDKNTKDKVFEGTEMNGHGEFEIDPVFWFTKDALDVAHNYEWCYEGDNYLQYGPQPSVQGTMFRDPKPPKADTANDHARTADNALQHLDGGAEAGGYSLKSDWPPCPIKPACYDGCTNAQYDAFDQAAFELKAPDGTALLDADGNKQTPCATPDFYTAYNCWLKAHKLGTQAKWDLCV